MKAIWRGQVIAESDRTLQVGGYRYFPRETVRMGLLAAPPRFAWQAGDDLVRRPRLAETIAQAD
jgi:hypothetical protein